MSGTTNSISFRGTRDYVDAIRRVAAERREETGERVTVGDLVRESLDAHLGEKLQPHLDAFAKVAHKNKHSNGKGSKHDSAS